MRAKHTETMLRMTREIQDLAKDLPPGKGHQIINRCSKINLLIRKSKDMNTEDNFTSQQIADRYIAKKAIFEAMTKGRKLSQMDCREFEVEDMRTPVSHMKDRFEAAGYSLKSQWIHTPKGRRIKEYWLERRVRS